MDTQTYVSFRIKIITNKTSVALCGLKVGKDDVV